MSLYTSEFGRQFVDFHESYNFTKHFTMLILDDLMVNGRISKYKYFLILSYQTTIIIIINSVIQSFVL